MQMRSCAIWLGVVGLIATASPAFAAPKGKKAKKAAASAEVKAEAPAEPAEKESGGDVDDLMKESTKRKPAAASGKKSDAESEPSADEPVGEPDAWERPPVEEEKPKPVAPMKVEEKKGDGRNVDVGLVVGYGFQTSKFFSVDPYGLGFGLRGAYELESHMVIGLGVEYFLGGSNISTNSAGAASGDQIKTAANYFLVHAEFGYNVWLDKLILRPSIWAGLSIGTQNPAKYSGTSGVITAFSLSPGLTLHYLLGAKGWFIGADARINFVLGEGNSGLLPFGTFGKRF
jgi:hypothetical protein